MATAATSSDEAAPGAWALGYATPFVAAADGRVEVRVSSTAGTYGADLVRLRSAGPGPRVVTDPLEGVDHPTTLAGCECAVPFGSSVEVGPSPAFERLRSFTASVHVLPTLLTPRAQVVMGTLDAEGERGWQVLADIDAGLGLRAATADGLLEVWSGRALREHRWSELTVRVDAEADAVTFEVADERDGVWRERLPFAVSKIAHADELVVGAPRHRDRPVGEEGNGCFNGKISRPRVLSPGGVVCELDLGRASSSSRFVDESPHRHPVAVTNTPTTGVTGPGWNGGSSSFRLDPDDYAALHLHDDDLEDADWDVAFTVELPSDIAPGVYAARLLTDEYTDHVPFLVTNPGRPRAEAAVLLPTLTYLAYANEHEILSNPSSYKDFTGREATEAKLTWRDRYSVETGLTSLYDVHRDGSTVCFASLRRPLVNVRPDYVWPLLDGPHGLAMDLRLLGWLEQAGFEVDLLSDHDLDAEGEDVLSPYRVVVTGAHPEYWTARMFDALEEYLGGGGRLLYASGNGLHGVAGIDPDRPHVAEVRRGVVGTRPSSSAPGEQWMTTTGEEGGTWRNRGRSSHGLIGVGTAAQGAGPGRGYRRSEASYEQEVSWVFEGVEGEMIGESGGILGGAGSYEFDRADAALGTPEEAVVLATASGFESLYFPMLEDFKGAGPELADPASPLVRADMVMVPGKDGGAVFSAGSAAWCGSLLDEQGLPTDVATVTGNVLRRFLATPRGADPLVAHAGGRS